jgi:prepilin-type N-terminal cleavage/methylation domain-containing protein
MRKTLKKKGFTLVETLVSVLIFSLMSVGLFVVLTTGQSTWHTIDVSVQLQQALRQSLQRVSRELHESGFDSTGACEVTIQDAAGPGNSDILRFKVPVDYDADGDVLDGGANIEWGAPLQWLSKTAGTLFLNYTIEYSLNNGQFLRKVYNATNALVRTDIFADHITDFQVSRNNNIVTLTVSSSRNTVYGRVLNASVTTDVLLRNRG